MGRVGSEALGVCRPARPAGSPGLGLAQNAREQLRELLGPDLEDVDWTRYDPRQYDPRQIVREALMDGAPLDELPEKPQSGPVALPPPIHDADRPTPWDADAT